MHYLSTPLGDSGFHSLNVQPSVIVPPSIHQLTSPSGISCQGGLSQSSSEAHPNFTSFSIGDLVWHHEANGSFTLSEIKEIVYDAMANAHDYILLAGSSYSLRQIHTFVSHLFSVTVDEDGTISTIPLLVVASGAPNMVFPSLVMPNHLQRNFIVVGASVVIRIPSGNDGGTNLVNGSFINEKEKFLLCKFNGDLSKMLWSAFYMKLQWQHTSMGWLIFFRLNLLHWKIVKGCITYVMSCMRNSKGPSLHLLT